jgi:hypothetical protein
MRRRVAPLDVPRRCFRTDAGGEQRARIKPSEPGNALPREPLDAADVPLDVPAASRPGRRGAMGCFGIGN